MGSRDVSKTGAHSGPGKLKNGFNMIARDLDRAFVLALLGTYEAFMLQNIREDSWAAPLRKRKKGAPLPDPTPCKPNVSALARKSGLSRCLLSRGLNSLVDARILTRQADGSILINKDYSQWIYPALATTPEQPRFGPEQLVFIREVMGLNLEPNGNLEVTEEPIETVPREPQALLPGSSSADVRDGQALLPGSSSFQGHDQPELLPGSSSAETPEPKTATQEYQAKCTTATQEYQALLPGSSSPAPSPIEERAPEFRESLESNLLTHTAPAPGRATPERGPNLRDQEDQADVDAAMAILASDLRTEALAIVLGRNHNNHLNIHIKGWQWIVASRRIFDVEGSAQSSFPYLRGIAQKTQRKDYEKLCAASGRPAQDSLIPVNGSRPSPLRRLTEEEKQAARNEGKKRTLAKIPDDMKI
jgi:hypothetical protein